MSRLLLFALCLCCVATGALAQVPLVINEVVYDSQGTDTQTWVELKGEPGLSLTGYRVVGIKGTDGSTYNIITLDGSAVPADGYFVIAQSAGQTYADLVTTLVDYQNGPNSIQLQQNVGGTWMVVDAVGYKNFPPGSTFAGEGESCGGETPGSSPAFNRSIARCPDGFDSNNNRADFISTMNMTPGAPNLTECPAMEVRLCDIAANGADGLPVLMGKWVHVTCFALIQYNLWQPNASNEVNVSDGDCCTTLFESGQTWPQMQPGDDLDVYGIVGCYNGKTEIEDPIVVITGSGHPLPTPVQITTGELAVNGANYESCLIKIRCANLTGGTWPPAGSDANLTIDDGSGSVTLRIDKDTNIDGTAPPTGPFTIIGLATQFDNSNPYTTGYQILPRSTDDLLYNDCAPPLGACCFPTGLCAELTATDCQAQSGTYLGDGTSCTPNPCAQPEACCFEDGSCQLLLVEDCTAQGGIPQGAGTICGERIACPQPPQACCFPDGSCQVLSLEDCLAQGGQSMGVGTVCVPNTCPQPPVACCFPDGHCEFVTAEICVQTGGVPQAFGTVCDPNPCPPPVMACCFADGHCELQTAEQCTVLGGTPQGFGTNCDPNLCPPPPPTGACCLDDQGHCQVMTQAECADASGAYQGDATTCEPVNPCPIVPTKGTTWGQIKANYR